MLGVQRLEVDRGEDFAQGALSAFERRLFERLGRPSMEHQGARRGREPGRHLVARGGPRGAPETDQEKEPKTEAAHHARMMAACLRWSKPPVSGAGAGDPQRSGAAGPPLEDVGVPRQEECNPERARFVGASTSNPLHEEVSMNKER